jgi:hypothetical protein
LVLRSQVDGDRVIIEVEDACPVRAHAGDIFVRNTPGGCIFAIDLPLATQRGADTASMIDKVAG